LTIFASAKRIIAAPYTWLWVTGFAYLAIVLVQSEVFYGERVFSLSDDQMISMRYGRNLADGFGLVWNPGELPVEGFSNLLWTLVMAVVHLLPIAEGQTSLWLKLIAIGVLLVNARLAGKLVKAAGGSASMATIAVILTATYWPLVHWTLHGFEVGAQALLTTAGVYLCLAPRSDERVQGTLLGLVCAALVLTRPDGMVPATLMIFLHTLARPAALRTSTTIAALWLALTVVAVTYWRFTYYGEFLPNTYYLKAVGVSASDRLGQGFKVLTDSFQTNLAVIFVLAAMGTVYLVGRGAMLLCIAAWAHILGALAYTVYLGGDTWEEMGVASRFISQAMTPMLAIAAYPIATVGAFAARKRFGQKLVGVAVICLVILSTGAIGWRGWRNYVLSPGHKNDGLYRRVEQGMWLKRNAPPDATVAVVWAGALPYFAHLKSYDMLGKSDQMIARLNPRNWHWGHNKWSHAYTFDALKPTYIEFLWSPTSSENQRLSREYRLNETQIYERKEIGVSR
jgi:hypothetical protein